MTPPGKAPEHSPDIHKTLPLTAAGNQAIQRALTAGILGRKLALSQPGEAAEREADAGMPGRGRALIHHPTVSSPPDVQSRLGPGLPLEPAIRLAMEAHLHADLGAVRIHTGEQAARAAAGLGARAFTVGQELAFGRGQYHPGAPGGRSLLIHELLHALQQGSGQVPLQVQRKTAEERIADHTSGWDLNEAALGSELAGLLPDGAADVQAVINSPKLDSTDKDDVSLEIVKHSSDTVLKAAGDSLLRLLRAWLLSGWTSDEEYQAIGRIDQLLGGIKGVDQSATPPAELSGTPAEIIDHFTTLNFLDEEGLGKALAARAVADPNLILSVLDKLGSTDRDDVSEAIVERLSDIDLFACEDRLLQRLRAELQGDAASYTTDSEARAIGRLDAAIRAPALAMPFEVKAPAAAISFDAFLKMVEDVEARFPAEEQVNTKLMITRFRKIFYGKKSWDEHLIPGAAGVAPVFQPEEKVTGERDVRIPYLPDLTKYVTTSYRLPGAPPNLQDPSQVQEVRMPDGSFVDVGHVFAGLDALNFPSSVSASAITPWIGISKNVDAVTWVGDLGSILAEAVLIIVENERQITPEEFQKTVDEYAPAQDMLGDIDAYVIGQDQSMDIGSSAGKKVSEILREYYLGAKSSKAQRYTIFAREIGLGELKAGEFEAKTFGGEQGWLDYYEDEVNDAAALYLGAGVIEKGSPYFGVNWLQRRSSAVGLAINAGSRDLLALFLRELKKRIQSEGGT